MEKPQKMPKVAKVKNKAPAEIQITAEQLLREAKERDLEILPPPPKQKISDEAEGVAFQESAGQVDDPRLDSIAVNRKGARVNMLEEDHPLIIDF